MSLRSKLTTKLQHFEKPFKTHNEITLSRANLLLNFDFFQDLVPDGNVIPVLKANAYGHGISEIAEILKERSFPYIAVDSFHESLLIHDVSSQPVLVMGMISPENFRYMDFHGVAFVVHDVATVRALGETKRSVNVHVEIDTGMTRYGVTLEKLLELLEVLRQYPALHVEGVMTHLADADNPNDDSFDDLQTERFDAAVEIVRAAGFTPKYIHIAQSAGSTKITSRHANTLRVGIALYGISPLEPEDDNVEKLAPLKPVLELTSTITKVNETEPGSTVSYSRTYTSERPERIGVIPFGYYEGLPRALSNVGTMQYENEMLPIVGRICMNHTMVRLGNSKATVGETVTIISRDPSSPAALTKICRTHNLFTYELLVGLNQNIRRRIIE